MCLLEQATRAVTILEPVEVPDWNRIVISMQVGNPFSIRGPPECRIPGGSAEDLLIIDP